MKTAIVIGSTGLVGTELVKVLLASPDYHSILLLNRRPSGHSEARISERLIDFDAPDLEGIRGDDLYCALGTTLRKAGSKAAQYKIDCEYTTTMATGLIRQGIKRIFLVSSVGADAKASNFYLRTKGQLEENIQALGFESTVLARPSFLIGERAEVRPGEKIGILLMKILSPFMFGPLRKYQGIEANQVAQRLVQEAASGRTGLRIIEFRD